MEPSGWEDQIDSSRQKQPPLLLTTVGVAGVFTWQSGNATAKIARYCIVADVVIALILCCNSSAIAKSRREKTSRHGENIRDRGGENGTGTGQSAEGGKPCSNDHHNDYNRDHPDSQRRPASRAGRECGI